MEMEFSDGGKRRRRLVLIVGIMLGVVAGILVLSSGNRAPSETAKPEPVQTRRILVAAVDIPERSIIDPSMLAAREVPDDPSFLTAIEDPAMITGRVTAITILQGQPISMNMIATGDASAAFSILSPSETISPFSPVWRAVSLSIPRERAVGGLVTAGQRVDLLVSLPVKILIEDATGQLVDGTTEDGYYSDTTTKVTLTDLELLSAEPDSGIYVFKADLNQAEEIATMLSVPEAQFAIVLRPEGDNRLLERAFYGETLNRVLQRYGYPLPEVIEIDRYPQPGERELGDLPPGAPSPTPTPTDAPVPPPTPVPAS